MGRRAGSSSRLKRSPFTFKVFEQCIKVWKSDGAVMLLAFMLSCSDLVTMAVDTRVYEGILRAVNSI